MPIHILMPALSPTMTEGNVASWLKNEGDSVQAGDILCEIETDKATMEVEATDEGTLARIVAPAGSEAVPVNAVIGLILEEGEDTSALEGAEAAAPAAAPAAPPAEPAAEAAAESAPAASAAPAAAAPAAAAPSPGGNGATPPAPQREPGARIFASPLARRMAKQAGLALEAIAGTGPNGRIVKVDVEAAIAAAAAAPAVAAASTPAVAAAPAPAAPAAPAAACQDAPASTMRKVIAQRLQEAKREVPHFYLTIDCAVDALLETRAQLNERSDDYILSVNDFVIRAAALALRKVPAANASWVDGTLRRYTSADVSVAVAIEDGLVTPIVRNADAKGLAEISAEVKELAGRARAKPMGLAPEEYQGGTFSVSNLGMFGIKEFAAIINPPQSMILAVGTAEQRPVVRDGALAVATMMSCTLSVDHRVVDGVLGARFLQAFKGLIEDPLTMLL